MYKNFKYDQCLQLQNLFNHERWSWATTADPTKQTVRPKNEVTSCYCRSGTFVMVVSLKKSMKGVVGGLIFHLLKTNAHKPEVSPSAAASDVRQSHTQS
jgi:hypothetical protein